MGLLRWEPLVPALPFGASVTSHSAAEVAGMLEGGGGGGGGGGEVASALLEELAGLLRERSVVLLRGGGSSELLRPQQASALYSGFMEAMGLRGVVLDSRLKGAGNNQAQPNALAKLASIQRAGFPGTPETVALGHSPDPLSDWHGLSGSLSVDETENTFWEKRTGNW